MTQRFITITGWGAIALLALGGFVAWAQAGGDAFQPKGIFLSDSDDRKTAVKFNVLLKRDGRERLVDSNHRFRDDDQMRFQFELNRDSYVYVVHRTFDGDPGSDRVRRYAGPKGIEVVRDENRRSDRPSDRDRSRSGRGEESYQLLFPGEKTGRTNFVKARTRHTVPTDRNTYFMMDDNPGIEKLYLVVAQKQLDIGDHFNLRDGRLRRSESGGDGRRDDSDGDVLNQLTAKLAEYGGNAALSFPKGIRVEEADGYGVGVDRGKPLMVEVDLAHHSK